MTYTIRSTTRTLFRATIPPPPPPPILRSSCPELEGSSAIASQLTHPSPPPNPSPRRSRHSRHSPHFPAAVTYFDPVEHEDIMYDYQVGKRTARADKELLAWAARLRYSHQILDSTDEIKSFTSKLCDLASQWEPSRLVKKVLTLVRSTTRSGRAYGVAPPDNPEISTARGEAFKEKILDNFPDYRPPSFFWQNFKGLSFGLDCGGLFERNRPKMATKLRSVTEEPERNPEQRHRRSIYHQFLTRLVGI